jgi:hypothetical protein
MANEPKKPTERPQSDRKIEHRRGTRNSEHKDRGGQAWDQQISRMRRAEIGHHHHIAGQYLLRYAQEASWREDNRRQSNGDQVNRLAGLALNTKPSVDFSG